MTINKLKKMKNMHRFYQRLTMTYVIVDLENNILFSFTSSITFVQQLFCIFSMNDIRDMDTIKTEVI